MKTNMRKFIGAAAVAFVAGTSLAGYVVSGKTITFTVAEGVVETNDMAMSSAYNTFVKDGPGTLVMTKDQDSDKPFGQGTVRILNGVLQLDVRGALGFYASVYISSGAQYYAHFGMGKSYTDYSTICQRFKSINGSGPDGTGAIRINNLDNAKWDDWRSCFRNEVTLGSDATIYVDQNTIVGFNAGSTLNLNGHTLTMAGAGRLYFGQEATNQGPPEISAGHIVNNMTGNYFWIKKGVTFKGSSENTLTLGASVANIYLENVTVPIAWKVVLKRTETTAIYVAGNLRDGKFDETVNDFAGGMDISGYTKFLATGTLTTANPRAVTFSGKVTSIKEGGTAEIACYHNDKVNNYLTIHLKHANDCGFVFYTGTGVAHVDDAFGQYISLPSNKDVLEAKPGTARVLLGEGKCTGAYAATLPDIVSAWQTAGTGAGSLEFYSDEEVSVPGPLTMKTTAVTLAHGGSGKVKVSGTVNACPIELRGTGIFEFDAGTMGASRVTSVVSGKPDVLALGGTVTSSSNLKGAYTTGSTAAFHQYGGTYTPPSGVRFTSIYGTGFYGLTGGTLNLNYNEVTIGSTSAYEGDPAVLESGRAVFQMDGGEVVQRGANLRVCYGGETDFLMRGGTYTVQTNKGIYFAGDTSSSSAVVEQVVFSMVGNHPVFDASAPDAWISMSSRPHNLFRAIFNLNAGVLKSSSLNTTHGRTQDLVYFNLNGGSIAWSDRNYVWVDKREPNELRIYEKGFTFEANYANGTTNRMFLTSAGLTGSTSLKLAPMSGRGVAKIRLPDGMPRTGYSAIAPVRVVTATNDVGWGATASLDFDIANGTVADELLITCSGNDYTNVPTVVAYGPDLTTPYECEVTLTDDNRVPGAFVKTGPGELTLNLGYNNTDRSKSPHNTYPGPYVISNGCLFVNYWSNIPTNSMVYVAGGCFRWDWTSRTIDEFGGWGTFFGSWNNEANTLTVKTRFNVDARDLAAGRSLLQSTEIDVDEKGVEKTAVGDNVIFGANCKVKIVNPEALDETVGDYLILRQSSIARLPELEEAIDGWSLRLRRGGTELHLKKRAGYMILER